MKIYKIRRLVGNHSKSMFPPKYYKPPPIEDFAGEPLIDLQNALKLYGYTPEQTRNIILAWAAHAKYDLNFSARQIRLYCEMNIASLPRPEMAHPSIFWPMVLLAASVAAVGLALYLWVELDTEYNEVFGSHPWAYIATYNETVYIAEIFRVSAFGRPYYEIGATLGDCLVHAERNVGLLDEPIDRHWYNGALKHEGRPLIFYHRFLWSHWDVTYLGLGHEVANRIYRLRSEDPDPFAPERGWWRPGGRMYTSQYEGCWKDWWWL